MDNDGYICAAPELSIDFEAIEQRFEAAARDGRNFLFEHETYEILKHSGAETPPKTMLLRKGTRISDEELTVLPGDKVVLKVVSPSIVHKSDVLGVRVVPNRADKIRSAWRRMLYEVPEAYVARIEKGGWHYPAAYRDLRGEALQSALARDIYGVLMVQFMPPDSEAFGNELIVGIRRTREFGMIINAGLGGVDTELFAASFRKGRAFTAASTELTDGRTFLERFRATITYQKMAGLARGQRRIVTDEQLLECFSSFIALANHYSPVNPDAPFIIEELEINPFAFTDFLMVPLDGLCRFSRPESLPPARPIAKIDRLLHPEAIGLIGASATRMNFGRIILNNIVAAGFDPAAIRVINPGAETIDGLVCLPDLESLDRKLDLLILAVDAAKVPELVEQIIERDAAESVMLIPGGIGETEDSRERAELVESSISAAHEREDGGPVFLGSNCLGVISHPGRYDTLFIPEEKLPKTRGDYPRRAAFISQSGAFMITRLSKKPLLDPAYLVSIGNQTDLTLGDMLTFLADCDSITTLAVYAEGFKDLDGLAFARAVRRAVLKGKDVIFYKAGRTPEGKTATSGHTASLAGDYMVCESCMVQAGAMVAQTFTQFESLFLLSVRLHDKEIRGNRVAAVSGAGFEAVGMADSIQSDDYAMQLAAFSPRSEEAIRRVLTENRLEKLVNIRNPLDINPGADDRVHTRIAEILSADPDVDLVVVGLDPLSPATYTLAGDMRFSMDAENSLARTIPRLAADCDRPIIGVVDSGRLYDPLVEALEKGGLPVFRSSDLALAAAARYVEGRLAADRIRLRDCSEDIFK